LYNEPLSVWMEMTIFQTLVALSSFFTFNGSINDLSNGWLLLLVGLLNPSCFSTSSSVNGARL